MCACLRCVFVWDVCLSKMCVCLRCVLVWDVCLYEMCVCFRCVFVWDVCVWDVCLLEMGVYLKYELVWDVWLLVMCDFLLYVFAWEFFFVWDVILFEICVCLRCVCLRCGFVVWDVYLSEMCEICVFLRCVSVWDMSLSEMCVWEVWVGLRCGFFWDVCLGDVCAFVRDVFMAAMCVCLCVFWWDVEPSGPGFPQTPWSITLHAKSGAKQKPGLNWLLLSCRQSLVRIIVRRWAQLPYNINNSEQRQMRPSLNCKIIISLILIPTQEEENIITVTLHKFWFTHIFWVSSSKRLEELCN